MDMKEQNKKVSQVIAKCWSDEKFKQKLINDPVTTLKEEGVSIPEKCSFKVVEDTKDQLHFIIPAKPDGLLEVALEGIEAGEEMAWCSCNASSYRSRCDPQY